MLWLPGKVNKRVLWPVLLYDQTLTGGDRFDVSGIPPSFSVLELILLARASGAVTGDSVYMYFNGDATAANYRSGYSFVGSSVTQTASDAPLIAGCPGASSPANYFGFHKIIVPFYTSGHQKIARAMGGERRDATVIFVESLLFHWESTAVINQITVQPDGYATDTFVAGSRLQIWGIP